MKYRDVSCLAQGHINSKREIHDPKLDTVTLDYWFQNSTLYVSQPEYADK